jgi:hypothetical protein
MSDRRDFSGDVQNTVFKIGLIKPVANAPAGSRGALPVHNLDSLAIDALPVIKLIMIVDRAVVFRVDP